MEYFLISIGERDDDLKTDIVPEEINIRLNSFVDYLTQKAAQIASITCSGYPLTISVASHFSNEFSLHFLVDHRLANYQSKTAYGYSQRQVTDPNCQNAFPLISDPRNETKKDYDFRVQDALNDVTPKGLYILSSELAHQFCKQNNFNMTSEQGIWHILYKDDPASVSLYEMKIPRLQESYEVPQSVLHQKIQSALEEAVGDTLNSLKKSDQAVKASINGLYDQVRGISKTINQLQRLFSNERSDEGESEGNGAAVVGAIDRDLDTILSMAQDMRSGLREVIEPEYIEIPDKPQPDGKPGNKKPKEIEITSVRPEDGSMYTITIKSHSSKVENNVDLYFESSTTPLLILRRIKSIRPHSTIEIKALIPLNTLLSTCNFWFIAKIGDEDCSDCYNYGIFKINVVKRGNETFRIDVINNTSMTLTANLVYGQKPDQNKSVTIKSRSSDEVLIPCGEGIDEKKFIMKYNGLEASNRFL